MIVVDASVLAPALSDDDPDGDLARARIAHVALAAPQIIDLEVISVFRRAARSRRLAPRRAQQAVDDLLALELHRVPHTHLLPRVWELRDTLSAYDAAYVALAEHLAAPLVTADRKLARAKGIACDVELLRAAGR